MSTFIDILISAWRTAAAIATELVRANPGLIAVPAIGGITAAFVLGWLRDRIWIPVFFNGDYRQGIGSVCVGIGAALLTAIGIVGVFALGSVESAADGWRERQRSSLSAADGWQFETFQQFFNEIRASKLEDLSNIPDPIANGGSQLPLTKLESWKLAGQFYNDAAWQRLRMDRAPLAGGWPEIPAPPELPVQPGMVTPNSSENPALFAAIENATRAAARHALQRVQERIADYRFALVVSMLLVQLLSWITISVSATRDISAS